MKKLLNTLYVTTENAFATLDGENIVLKERDQLLGRFPLHILKSIYLFTYGGASPALMGKCAELGIDLVFFRPNGKFLARTVGTERGNVLLRKQQYRLSEDEAESVKIVRNFEFGKIYNGRQLVCRMKRDHPDRIDPEKFDRIIDKLKDLSGQVRAAENVDSARGIEGAAASLYFGLFDDFILRDKENFFFHERNRRPPMDNVNSLLSFVYTMLASDCASALEAAGLDPYVGFLHQDRPGRKSLALDLMEELRACLADRFVLTLVNNRVVDGSSFIQQESGAVLLKDDCRKKIHQEWQKKKMEVILHPFLQEKVEWGLIPHTQAMLLARYIRGDLDAYPPFLWR